MKNNSTQKDQFVSVIIAGAETFLTFHRIISSPKIRDSMLQVTVETAIDICKSKKLDISDERIAKTMLLYVSKFLLSLKKNKDSEATANELIKMCEDIFDGADIEQLKNEILNEIKEQKEVKQA